MKIRKWKFLKLNGVIDRQYKVSDHGDIVHTKDLQPLTQYDMGKKSPRNGTDYKSVSIPNSVSVPNVCKSVRVHRIVCETFHGEAPVGKNLVAHFNDRKNDNKSSNLGWVSSSENMTMYYENNPYVKYSDSKVSQVKRLVNKLWTNDRIAQKVGMSDSNVSSIKFGYIHSAVEPFTENQLELGN